MIRRLPPEDAAIWRRIRLEGLATAPEAFSARHANWAARPLADFRQQVETSAVFVAETGGQVQGSACLVADRDAGQPQRGWVLSVYVTPIARGAGIGTALLAAVIAEARARGLQELFLDVGRDNPPARALYAGKGFRAVPDADRPEGSNAAREISMKLVLG